MDRFVFTCSKCQQAVIVPGDSQQEAAEFLLEKTPWVGKASPDGTALFCAAHRHLSPEETGPAGCESASHIHQGQISDRHFCKWERQEEREAPMIFGKTPKAVTCVESGDGRFWLDLDEDIVMVRACPICGKDAPVRETPRDVPMVGPLEPDAPSSVAAYAMRSGKVPRGVPAARWVVQSHCATVECIARALEREQHRGVEGIGLSTARGMEELFEKRYGGEFTPDVELA